MSTVSSVTSGTSTSATSDTTDSSQQQFDAALENEIANAGIVIGGTLIMPLIQQAFNGDDNFLSDLQK